MDLKNLNQLLDTLDVRDSSWKNTYKIISEVSEQTVGVKFESYKHFCSFMILLKIMRYYKSEFKENDCLLDIIGYANLVLSEEKNQNINEN